MENKIIVSKPIIVCVVGLTYCGKNIQAKRLVEHLWDNGLGLWTNFHDNGEALRAASEDPRYTDYMKKVLKDTMNKDGGTIAGSVTISLLTDFLMSTYKGNNNSVLTGVFRTENEPSRFVDFTDKHMPGVPRFFFRINISEETAWNRYKKDTTRERDDENDKAMKGKFEEYKKYNLFYEKIMGEKDFISFNIDGEQSIPEIHGEIVSKLLSI